jgi:spore photoproduct lyase
MASVIVARESAPVSAPPKPKLWAPKRVLVTPAALEHAHGRAMVERAAALGAAVTELKSNRLTGLAGDDARRAYADAKGTLAITVASEAKRRLQPIPPSADWRFDLAEGCPAHCQYCYLAGSLPGPPVTRAYANIEEILGGLATYAGRGAITSKQAARAHEGTTFEASCYTDPLGIEHITGSLAEAIRHFGAWESDVQLRWTTKYDGVDPLLGLPHRRRTRVRVSVNAEPVVRRIEGGTAPLSSRLAAMGRLAQAGYPVGLTIAPIMPIENWRESYGSLLDDAAAALAGAPDLDLTAELITHRFTPGSKSVLQGWYPGSSLEMDEAKRSKKLTKFGSVKHVYPAETMRELRGWFEREIAARLPAARLLYWT